MVPSTRVAARLLFAGGEPPAPEPLLLADADIAARLAALATEVLRERLPELLHRHVLPAPPFADALGLSGFALQHAALFARVLGMQPSALVASLEWLCLAQGALAAGVYGAFARERGGPSPLALDAAFAPAAALVLQGALPGSPARHNLLLLRAHLRQSRPDEPPPAAPPAAPPAWVRECAAHAKHDATGRRHSFEEGASEAVRAAQQWVRTRAPALEWLGACAELLQPAVAEGAARLTAASPGVGGAVALPAHAVDALACAMLQALEEHAAPTADPAAVEPAAAAGADAAALRARAASEARAAELRSAVASVTSECEARRCALEGLQAAGAELVAQTRAQLDKRASRMAWDAAAELSDGLDGALAVSRALRAVGAPGTPAVGAGDGVEGGGSPELVFPAHCVHRDAVLAGGLRLRSLLLAGGGESGGDRGAGGAGASLALLLGEAQAAAQAEPRRALGAHAGTAGQLGILEHAIEASSAEQQLPPPQQQQPLPTAAQAWLVDVWSSRALVAVPCSADASAASGQKLLVLLHDWAAPEEAPAPHRAADPAQPAAPAPARAKDAVLYASLPRARVLCLLDAMHDAQLDRAFARLGPSGRASFTLAQQATLRRAFAAGPAGTRGLASPPAKDRVLPTVYAQARMSAVPIWRE